MKKLTLLFALLFLVSLAGFGQTILTNTTLSAAVTSSTQTVPLTSTTNVNIPSNTNYTLETYLYVDRELMDVENVVGSNAIVRRGAGGTVAYPHASGALVFVVPAYLSLHFQELPQGSCTRSNELLLPRIQSNTGIISDCLGGQWVQGDASQTTRAVGYHFTAPAVGASNSGTALGSSTAGTQYDTYCTEIDLPYSKLITGLAPHIGATGGTDSWIVGLYDATGNLLANSGTSGTTVSSTAYAWQAQALTSKYYAVGPAVYYGCVITNGTHATLDLTATGKGDQITTTIVTGTGFTLPSSITAPTSFTTANGPFLYVY